MDPGFIQEYERFEVRHWWHVARRRIIESLLDRHCVEASRGAVRWLDIGCGTGVMLQDYVRIGIGQKVGLDTEPLCVERARAKGLDVRLTGADWDLSKLGKFDLISLCDVIEHVADERPALRRVREALRPGGVLLVTVPALMSLWSSHDVINHHYRRYDLKQLAALFDAGQWEILKASYFSSVLFPLIWGFRKIKNIRESRADAPPKHDNRFGPRVVDALLYYLFVSERRLLRHGRLPIGSSLVLVARRREG
jgi:SAM-dependent methyltransferase